MDKKNNFKNLDEGSFINYCKRKRYEGANSECIAGAKTRKRVILAENFKKINSKRKNKLFLAPLTIYLFNYSFNSILKIFFIK